MTSSNRTARSINSGARMLAFATVLALMACANATTAAKDPVNAPTRVAGAATEDGASVEKVSDAVEQRLDGMLNQSAHHP